ncbi:MAG: glycine dehydrogenase [Candidatus Eisenbacteria bacterium]|nr:glycine dehydrogenase [Candidatus Eisenbacteria bacterium]
MATYVGRSENERQEMLRTVGVRALEDLLSSVPPAIRGKARIALEDGLSEFDMAASMSELASENASSRGAVCFAGAGVYDHFVPAAVRQLLLRSEFYTCYTPYQAEVSQGTLQAIFEFQSLMCRLTGMDVCNASMYDAATALAEAALLAVNATEKRRVLVSAGVHPNYRKVLSTYCAAAKIEVEEIPLDGGTTDVTKLAAALEEVAPRGAALEGGAAPKQGAPPTHGAALKGGVACFIHQQPNFYGVVEDTSRLGEVLSGNPALLVSCVDPLSLSVLEPPGSYGADVVVGEGQALGSAMNFGGPLVGFFASRSEYVRRLPGRIVGMTTDNSGRRGFVLTLQTREQHIRRAKATSNICTNEALVALTATIYLALVGERGLKELASQCLAKSHYAAEKLAGLDGFSLAFEQPFFKEFVLRCPVPAEALVEGVLSKGMLAGVPLSRFSDNEKLLLVAVTEKRTKKEIDGLCTAVDEVAKGLRLSGGSKSKHG